MGEAGVLAEICSGLFIFPPLLAYSRAHYNLPCLAAQAFEI
jgi:hypothetical protein